MSRFVRPASWLRWLFTSSQTSPVNPVEVSDDVSLVQPFDGGGYPLFDPGQWGLAVASATAASGTTTVLTVPANTICRLLAASVTLNAGVAPSTYFAVVPEGGDSIGISPLETGVLTTFHLSAELRCPILPPGAVLSGRWLGGDAATNLNWHILYVLAPIGSVFYL